jgi:hypothetical protein
MKKKAFNPGDWKNPRKKEILRCAQDDRVGTLNDRGNARGDKDLVDEI